MLGAIYIPLLNLKKLYLTMCPSFIKFGSNCFTHIEDFVGVTYIRTEGTDGRSDVRMDGPTLVLFRVQYINMEWA